MRVIGTAGHVDHGKSTLVQALTGINPDRLREEQERQMTIDLGFAWFTLDQEDVGIVDVPGHRDFIENMLAGVGGIDAALLVIAADEGVMPQTREHLAILDLLDVERAVVALTKIDLIQDPEWLDLVEDDLAELLASTRMAGAPIIRVSAIKGIGLDDLKAELASVLRETKPRVDRGRARLPVDRSFTIAGFGTVVTGTLQDGVIQVGQEVEVLPAGLKGRVRGLQTHKIKVERAVPGSRAAVNLTGVDVHNVGRGDTIAEPGVYTKTTMLDASFRMLPDSKVILKHNQEVKLFLGASQRLARVRVLGEKAISPGASGWVQLMLREPVIAARGDRYILRRPSPGATLGGGQIADPHPTRRHRLQDLAVVRKLEQYLHGSPADVLRETLREIGPTTLAFAAARAALDEESVQDALRELEQSKTLIRIGSGGATGQDLFVDHLTWEELKGRVSDMLNDFHGNFPLRAGMPREELKSKLGFQGKEFSAILKVMIDEEHVREDGSSIALRTFSPQLTEAQERACDAMIKAFDASPFSPPSVKESLEIVGEELFYYLIETEQLVQVSADVVFTAQVYAQMLEQIKAWLQKRGSISVAEARDLFSTSRKYTLALLEHLDALGITVREEDVRRLV